MKKSPLFIILAVSLLAVPGVFATLFSINTIEGDDIGPQNLGQGGSIDVQGNGNVHIAYRERTDPSGSFISDLKYSLWNGTNLSIEVVNGDITFGFPSIDVDTSGTVYISYQSESFRDLKVATLVGSGGNCGGGKWQCDIIDGGGDSNNRTGRQSFLTLDGSGTPHVSYQDVNIAAGSTFDLKYATFVGSGGNCGPSGSWRCELVDGDGPGINIQTTGFVSSIAVDSGSVPHIVYIEAADTSGSATSDLRYARRVGSGGNCGGGKWSCETIEGDGTGLQLFSQGSPLSIVIDSLGRPHVSYIETQNSAGSFLSDLRHAVRVGSGGNCGGGKWDCELVDGDGTGFRQMADEKGTAIRLDSSGDPHIAYADASTGCCAGFLTLASFVGSGGSCGNSKYDCETVDGTRKLGIENQVFMDLDSSDRTHFGYGIADPRQDLRYTHEGIRLAGLKLPDSSWGVRNYESGGSLDVACDADAGGRLGSDCFLNVGDGSLEFCENCPSTQGFRFFGIALDHDLFDNWADYILLLGNKIGIRSAKWSGNAGNAANGIVPMDLGYVNAFVDGVHFIHLTLPVNTTTLERCDDNGSNCTNVTSFTGVSKLDGPGKNWSVPASLGFSTYGIGGAGPADADGDGFLDSVDNCAAEFNPDQSDIDSDCPVPTATSCGDVCDVCPDDATNVCNATLSVGVSVNASGATLTNAGGEVNISIPAGALDNDTSISMTKTNGTFLVETTGRSGEVIYEYTLGIPGTTFNVPITLTFTFDPTGLTGTPRVCRAGTGDTCGPGFEDLGFICTTTLGTCTGTVTSFTVIQLFVPRDTDGDGIFNSFDFNGDGDVDDANEFDDCPNTPGLVQFKGCPSAIRITNILEDVDEELFGVEELPVVGAEIKVFELDRRENVVGLECDDENSAKILATATSVGSCVTGSDGSCVVGVLPNKAYCKIKTNLASLPLFAGKILEDPLPAEDTDGLILNGTLHENEMFELEFNGEVEEAEEDEMEGSVLKIIAPKDKDWDAPKEYIVAVYDSKDKWLVVSSLTVPINYRLNQNAIKVSVKDSTETAIFEAIRVDSITGAVTGAVVGGGVGLVTNACHDVDDDDECDDDEEWEELEIQIEEDDEEDEEEDDEEDEEEDDDDEITGDVVFDLSSASSWLGLISVVSIIALVIVTVSAFNKLSKKK